MFKDIEKLIEQCIFREEKAWAIFIERFSGILYYSVRERLKRYGIHYSQQDIEDIVQTVFLEIWQKGKLEEVRDRRKIGTWLSIVAQNKALSYMRHVKERLLDQHELEVVRGTMAGDYIVDEYVERKLNKTLEEFDVRTQIILKLNIIYGRSHKEIARFMNLSINTVSTILARKKKILQEKLKDGLP